MRFSTALALTLLATVTSGAIITQTTTLPRSAATVSPGDTRTGTDNGATRTDSGTDDSSRASASSEANSSAQSISSDIASQESSINSQASSQLSSVQSAGSSSINAISSNVESRTGSTPTTTPNAANKPYGFPADLFLGAAVVGYALNGL